MEVLQAHFKKKFDSRGVALTAAQLMSFAKEKKLKGISKKHIYAFLSSHKDLAQFSPARKTKDYQTSGVMRPGTYHIDYGEFHKNWASHNSGYTGFLVAVENFTNKLFAIPTKGKGTQEWLSGISSFVEATRDVRTILSDRDSVATSSSFLESIEAKYQIDWKYLRKGNKAYLAERFIGFLKTKLSQALLHGGGDKNWIQYLPAICEEYNNTTIEGTTYKRKFVSRENFGRFLSQLLKDPQPELRFNGFKAGPFDSAHWNSKIFLFNLGDRVLLSRKANWKENEEKLGSFTKISAVGGFGKTVFTISGRQLRASKGLKSYVPVYSLIELGPSLHFYTNELKRAPVHF